MTAKVYLGFGSNEGDRLKNLELAISRTRARAKTGSFRVSPIYETPALLPEDAPDEWNRPYLNLVTEGQFDGSPEDLLSFLKQIETDLGRVHRERWAPRPVDIDLLLWGNERLQSEVLTVPHEQMLKRAFVLDPLKDLNPTLRIPFQDGLTSLTAAKSQSQHTPLWMGIINTTPDSFSDGGSCSKPESVSRRLDEWDAYHVAIIDLGAESTRPGASPITSREEWVRLEPVLKQLHQRYQGQELRPLISIDTRHAMTAALALEMGADIINDVSGLADPDMLAVLQRSKAQYILMHSLGVPANRKVHLPRGCDPIAELMDWFKTKTALLEDAGISRNRIILDPGIGFGKTALQSTEILRNLEKLSMLPFRLMVGHSRKSFLSPLASDQFYGNVNDQASNRDLESAGVSIHLASQGVDILRVHDPITHIRAFRAWNHINRSAP